MYQILLQNKGYTLVSLLFSLTILFLITPLTIYLIKPINDFNEIHYFPYYELSQFEYFIRNELNHASNIELEQHKIHFYRSDGSKVTFELYNDQIRRRVNHSGHEVLIHQINQFIVEPLNENFFEIIIVGRDGYDQKQTYHFKNKTE